MAQNNGGVKSKIRNNLGYRVLFQYGFVYSVWGCRVPSLYAINDFNPFLLGGSEDAGWNKPGDCISVDHVSDWPVLTSTSISLNNSPTTSSIVTTSGDTMIALHDDLETVLERLGLGKYYHLFQVCRYVYIYFIYNYIYIYIFIYI